MKTRLFAAFALLATFAVALTISCAQPKKAGLDLNNNFEVSATLAETPVVSWNKAAADTAATATQAEQPVAILGAGPVPVAISNCQWDPGATVGADASSNATITLYKRTAATDAGVALATASNASAGWTSFVPVAMTAGDAGQYLSPGDSVTVAITKLDSGVVVPAGQIDCFTTLH